jgi:PAS domain S-box-containing protein
MSPHKKRISEWLHAHLFHQVPVDIAVIDRDYRVIEANRRFERRYGDWRGRHCYEVYKGKKERCQECGAAETFEDGRVQLREEEGGLRDGRMVYYMVHIAPLRDPQEEIRYVIEMSTDVTGMHELQEMLRNTEREKLEAERLAAVGQTVAGLAHGIKNVLMGLEGGMYVLRSGVQKHDQKRIERGWQMLDGNVGRITTFVREFLDFARGREPHVQMIDPNEPARQVYQLFHDAAANNDVDLSINLQEPLRPAPMDGEGIHTCLANLVSNAVDACLMSTRGQGRVVMSSREEGSTLVYQVEDDGAGMDVEVKQKLFTTFFSTKASGEGTGLGLLVTRRIVQEHGGRVAIDSTEGHGSTFRLEFPRDRLPLVSKEKGKGCDPQEPGAALP